ncbi:MAG: hypothetical protein ACQEV0_03880 [Bacillota bacterium]
MKKLTVLLIVLLALSACSEETTHRFSGSGDHWDVHYVFDVKGNRMEESGVATYIGEGDAPEAIDYSVQYSFGSMRGTDVFVREGSADIGGSACGGCVPISEEEELKVKIYWGGQIETIFMANDDLN